MYKTEEAPKTINYVRFTIRGTIGSLILFLFLFVPAGRLNYWQGWLYLAVTILFMILFLVLFRQKADLLQERIKPGPGIKWWDKIFFVLFMPTFYAISILGAWDTGRCGWTRFQSDWRLYMLGYLLYIGGLLFFCWAMWINKFFSSAVRIQSDRGQEVVDRGPYAYIRHPGYVGMLAMMFGVPFCLGSLYALIPATLASLTLLVRTSLEDATLQAELPGYREYAQRVRWKLIRGIW
jgi:protein-S-isoprenylcysteine O-methyltransferase Ste14